jgi:hypothetical protein
MKRHGWLCAAVLSGLLAVGCGAKCEFELQQAQVVGYGDLMSYPGLWNDKGVRRSPESETTGVARLDSVT